MTPLEYASASLHFGLAVLLVWLLCFHFWRQYRIDVLREKLFNLRADLFDYAADGKVSFDNPAYARLRVVINGMIRFAHKFTFTRIAIVILFRNDIRNMQPSDPLALWREAVSKLPEESQKILQELHNRMLAAIVGI